MTKKELLEKLGSYPDDAVVEIHLPIKVNSMNGSLTRKIDSINFLDKNNIIQLDSNGPVQFYF